jgi:hypothetical protein
MKNRCRMPKVLMIALVAGGFTSLARADHTIRVHSASRFEDSVVKYPFAVGYFYKEDKDTRRDPTLKQHIKSMSKTVKALARSYGYRDADLKFVAVNTARDELSGVAQDYGITILPAFILFKDGVALRDKKGVIISKSGFITTQELKRFINQHLGRDLLNRREEKAEERLIRAQEAAYYWYNYPYWSFDYPVYPYYYPRGGFGFGFYV